MGRGWKRIAPDAETAPVPYPTEPDQGIARSSDRSHQLQSVLGQPVPCAADRRRLRSDAGVAPASRTHQLRSRSGLDPPRTAAEIGRACGGLGAPRGAPSARVVSVSFRLPASLAVTRSLAGIARTRRTDKSHVPLSRRLRVRTTRVQKSCDAPTERSHGLPDPVIRPILPRHEHLRRNLVLPTVSRRAFTNNAG